MKIRTEEDLSQEEKYHRLRYGISTQMTYRQWAAATLMAGMLANSDVTYNEPANVAVLMADALIKELSK